MLIALSACNGVMDGIYDDPQKPAQGDLYVDATSWTEWHYIKFNNSQLSTLNSQLSTHSLYQRFIDAGFLGGVKLEDGLLFAVTEKRTKEEIDNLVKIAAS